VTLHQVLDIIVKVAGRPLKYSIEDYGVIISLRTAADSPPLHTRWFKIDPNTFMRRIQEAMPSQFDPATMRRLRSRDQSATNDIAAEFVGELIRMYLQNAGVVLAPPKSIIFKDRRGMLMVRATLADLDVIEQALQVLNTAPPQVQIEVKFCEVPEELLAAPGLKLQPTTTAMNLTGANGTNTTMTSVLTPEQSRNILRALEQKEDVTILAMPKLLMPSGRQGQLKTVDVKTIVTGLDLTTNAPPAPGQPSAHPPVTEQIELGPTVDFVPYVSADGRTIQMTVIPSVKEFIGYDVDDALSKEIWDYVALFGVNPLPGSQSYPLPIFRRRQVVSSVTVSDGQTFVLASRTARTGVPDGHLANKLPKELTDQLSASILRMQKAPQKAMLLFITPTIVDPAGNAFHTDADVPAGTNSEPSILPPPLK